MGESRREQDWAWVPVCIMSFVMTTGYILPADTQVGSMHLDGWMAAAAAVSFLCVIFAAGRVLFFRRSSLDSPPGKLATVIITAAFLLSLTGFIALGVALLRS